MEDVWSITSSNKWFIEVPEEDEMTRDNIDSANSGGTEGYSVDQDEFEIHAGDGVGGEWQRINLIAPALISSQNARFSCEFEIDTDEGVEWNDTDFAYFGCFRIVPARGFGFKIKHDDGIYKLYIYLGENAGLTEVRVMPVNGIVVDTIYQVEARYDWEEGVVEYYFGSDDEEYHIIGILPLEEDRADYANIRPMFAYLEIGVASVTNQAYLIFHRWRTQVKKQPEMI